MERKWDWNSAVNYLNNVGLEVDVFHNSIIGKSTNGLKACSAVDYLRNQHNYVAIFIRNLVSTGG